MAFVEGERFDVSLGEEDERPPRASAFDFIGDIKERVAPTPRAPTAPSLKSTTTGFPQHKKRVSAFKKQRDVSKNISVPAEPPPQDAINVENASYEEVERRKIDQENKQRLAQMTPAEIEQERRELFEGLSPALIEKLLRRSNIDDNPVRHDEPQPAAPPQAQGIASNNKKSVKFDNTVGTTPKEQKDSTQQSEELPDLTQQLHATAPDVHFPRPSAPPELDENSPNFLDQLHEKYYPDLAHDPSKLAWMEPADDTDEASPYHPSHASLEPEQLRFDFKGRLIPPNLARQIPTNQGLHHHGDAPESAGYTIPELARLSRSRFAPQRSVAFCALGRLLFRLGSGEFGDETEEMSRGQMLCKGLWDLVEATRVLETLTEEVNKSSGNLSAKSYAEEALWNWKRSGGRKRKAV
ncbi:hypothetical protein K402DRAFT_392047 [Aulographum hederae CBS 113979]|uniref:Transcription factor Rba50 n=1 Tax=Aulographum hederae CBS 113979 TaxID=1176131 RepID=A0A6G1H4Z0_9PEZI|nr:hypothetical protein K402DRAFT_392047 [Aulographum hederae CBS 113979]